MVVVVVMEQRSYWFTRLEAGSSLQCSSWVLDVLSWFRMLAVCSWIQTLELHDETSASMLEKFLRMYEVHFIFLSQYNLTDVKRLNSV